MDFDLERLAVPFRMQPGLRRMASGERHLTPLSPGSALAAEKQLVVQTGQAIHIADGFHAQTATDAIHELARAEGHETRLAQAGHPALAFEEDLAIIDGPAGRLVWMCICTPSHWAPEDKLGLDFAAVHAPVADNQMLLAASAHLLQLATSGAHWERHVWTVTPSPRYDQHPRRWPRTNWPDAADPQHFAAGCHLRAERQTLLPIGQGKSPHSAQAMFTIRVMLQPLTQAVTRPEQARRLHDSLASMSDAVLAYKGLSAARMPLLAWLNQRPSPWN